MSLTLNKKTKSVVMSSLKYLVSEVVWSGGIFLAAQTQINAE